MEFFGSEHADRLNPFHKRKRATQKSYWNEDFGNGYWQRNGWLGFLWKNSEAQDTLELESTSSEVANEQENNFLEGNLHLTQILEKNKGQGFALNQITRQEMEQMLKYDFTAIRIHTGEVAEEICVAIGAQAFTYGLDIYFSKGTFSPETKEGKSLLLHELMHIKDNGIEDNQIRTYYSVDLAKSLRESILFNQKKSLFSFELLERLYRYSGNMELYKAAVNAKVIGLDFTLLVLDAQKYLTEFYAIHADGKLGDLTISAMNAWEKTAGNYNKNIAKHTVDLALINLINETAKDVYLATIAFAKKDAESREFAWLVLKSQRVLFNKIKQQDGQLGPGTKTELQKRVQSGIVPNMDVINSKFNISSTADNLAPQHYRPKEISRNSWNLFEKKYPVVWDSNPFEISVYVEEERDMLNEDHGTLPPSLKIKIRYTGDGTADIPERELNLGTIPKVDHYNPLIYIYSEKEKHNVYIDLLLAGNYTFLLDDIVTPNTAWTPSWNKHEIAAGKFDKKSGSGVSTSLTTINIIPKSSVPTVSGLQNKKYTRKTYGTITDLVTLPALTELQAAQTALNNIISNEVYGGSTTEREFIKQSFPLYLEQAQKEDSNELAKKGAGLYNAIQILKPKFLALQPFKTHELHPESIANEAVELANEVAQKYDAVLMASFDNVEKANILLAIADKAFDEFSFKLPALYLRPGQGLEAEVNTLGNLSYYILEFRKKTNSDLKYQEVDGMLGLNYSNSNNPDIAARLRQTIMVVRERYSAGDVNTLTNIMHVFSETRKARHISLLMYYFELFKVYEQNLNKIFISGVDTVLPGNASQVSKKYIEKFKNILSNLNDTYSKLKGTLPRNEYEALKNAEEKSVLEFLTEISKKEFGDDLTFVTNRLETAELIEHATKQLAITLLAAAASFYVGPAAGLALRTMGAGATATKIGVFAAEVFTFTVADQAGQKLVFGKTQSSFMEALATNTLLFGAMKAVSIGHRSLFTAIAGENAPQHLPGLFTASETTATLISLQAIGMAHHTIMTGTSMSDKEQVLAFAQNIAMMAGIRLGAFLGKPYAERMQSRTWQVVKEKYNAEYTILEQNRKILEQHLLIVRSGKGSPEATQDLLARLEKQFNSELEMLEQLKKDGKSEGIDVSKDIAEYKNKIIETEVFLSSLGFEVKTSSKQYFRIVKPGVVAYMDAEASTVKEQLQLQFKDKGAFEELDNGVFQIRIGLETVMYVKESLVKGYLRSTGVTSSVIQSYVPEAKARYKNDPEGAIRYIKTRMTDRNAVKYLEDLLASSKEKSAILEDLAGAENKAIDSGYSLEIYLSYEYNKNFETNGKYENEAELKAFAEKYELYNDKNGVKTPAIDEADIFIDRLNKETTKTDGKHIFGEDSLAEYMGINRQRYPLPEGFIENNNGQYEFIEVKNQNRPVAAIEKFQTIWDYASGKINANPVFSTNKIGRFVINVPERSRIPGSRHGISFSETAFNVDANGILTKNGKPVFIGNIPVEVRVKTMIAQKSN
jgi:hypothetical protein